MPQGSSIRRFTTYSEFTYLGQSLKHVLGIPPDPSILSVLGHSTTESCFLRCFFLSARHQKHLVLDDLRYIRLPTVLFIFFSSLLLFVFFVLFIVIGLFCFGLFVFMFICFAHAVLNSVLLLEAFVSPWTEVGMFSFSPFVHFACFDFSYQNTRARIQQWSCIAIWQYLF